MRPRLASAPLLGIVLLFGGCSVLPKAEPTDAYRLPQTPLSKSAAAAVPWSLRVDTPTAGRAIDSARIAVMPHGDVVSVYQGARWSDDAPVLLRNRLVDAFRNDGRIAAVTSDDVGLPTRYALGGELRAFQAEYQGAQPNVVIRYDARVVERSKQAIVAEHSFVVTQPVGATEVPAVVAAFGLAGDKLAQQLVDWVLQLPLQGADNTEAAAAKR